MDRFGEAVHFFYENFTPLSITHDLNHIERVAKGALFFADFLGIEKNKKRIIEIAAYYHDFIRPNNSETDHAAASAAKAKDLLPEFGFSKEETEGICYIIERHSFSGEDTQKKPDSRPVSECVLLADKLFECSGHYIAFRRALYVGESYKGNNNSDKMDALKGHYRKKFEQIKNYPFMPAVKRIRDNQLKAEREFVDALELEERWAEEISLQGFERGFSRNGNTDSFIKEFRGREQKAVEFREKAAKYIKWDLSNILEGCFT